MLEQNLGKHATLSVGDVLQVWHRGKPFELKVVEVQPEPFVTVIDTDIEVRPRTVGRDQGVGWLMLTGGWWVGGAGGPGCAGGAGGEGGGRGGEEEGGAGHQNHGGQGQPGQEHGGSRRHDARRFRIATPSG